MSHIEELCSAMESMESDAAQARRHTEEILSYGRDQVEFIQGHGWIGIAESVAMAVEQLEAVADQLFGVHHGAETAWTALQQIDAQMGRSEAMERLVAALDELDTARIGTEGVLPLLDEARLAVEQAEHESLSAQVASLSGAVEELLEKIVQLREDVESERQEVEDLGQDEG